MNRLLTSILVLISLGLTYSFSSDDHNRDDDARQKAWRERAAAGSDERIATPHHPKKKRGPLHDDGSYASNISRKLDGSMHRHRQQQGISWSEVAGALRETMASACSGIVNWIPYKGDGAGATSGEAVSPELKAWRERAAAGSDERIGTPHHPQKKREPLPSISRGLDGSMHRQREKSWWSLF